jgi:hypothetical protein
MKIATFKKGLLLAATLLVSLGATNQADAQVTKNTANDGDQGGVYNGAYWKLWKQGTNGTAYLTFGYPNEKGKFNFVYKDTGNSIGGQGWATGSTSRVVTYNVSRFGRTANSAGQVVGQLDLSIYGWVSNGDHQVSEYYVTEMWQGNRPSGTYLGDYVSGSSAYNLYRVFREGEPAWKFGSADFYQYRSVRTQPRPLNTRINVSLSDHFRAWSYNGLRWTSRPGDFSWQVLAAEQGIWVSKTQLGKGSGQVTAEVENL